MKNGRGRASRVLGRLQQSPGSVRQQKVRDSQDLVCPTGFTWRERFDGSIQLAVIPPRVSLKRYQQRDMSREPKTVRPYRMHLNRIRNAQSILLGAFLLMALALVILLTSPFGVALALSLGTLALAVSLLAYAYSAPCPMCGRLFYFRFVQHRSLLGHFARETTIFDTEPQCVNCGFVPEART